MPLTPELLRASWRSWINYQEQGRVGPAWLQWVWTLLFCVVIAGVVTVFGMFSAGWRLLALPLWFGRNLVISLTIGILAHALFDLLGHYWATPARVRGWAMWQRTVFFSGVPLAAVFIGWPLGVMLLGADLRDWFGSARATPIVIGSLAISGLITVVLHYFFAAKAREYRAEQQATEARLRLLQGQIEPHFLFNTLANVQGLIDADPARAKAMLEAFTDYLRASLGQLRSGDCTLGAELEMVERYLLLLQTRMGERLRFRFEVEPGLAALPLPPLLLQPLVENAIHHGLEPKIGGGEIVVTAQRVGGRLHIEVQDDGLGLDAPRRPGRGGNGMALDNIRSRLAGRWPAAASLELLPRDTGGTRARLTLPLETPA